ncbi:hypothetical protein ACGFNY_04810 [Streptomyces chartreusis]|uniref:hypothetical protein n=1 Tax=Streptomyces chartreusis TaxID=1969 RepID=UPI00371B27D1
MPAQKAPPSRTRNTPAEPVLEHFYTVAEAAIRLGLRKPEDPTTTGEKWLRDGVNKEGWPCHRMARQLLFSDSDLAEIAQLHRNKKDARSRPRPSRTPLQRRRAASKPAPAAA